MANDSSFPPEAVDSSNLATVGYDSRTKELFVTFKSSGEYIYHNVSARDAVSLLHASSKGKFLNAVIKPNYPYTRE